jgi:4-oxalocrotonate tautomerase
VDGEHQGMPIIHISMFEGRSIEQKRRLARAMTDLVVSVLDADPGTVRILFSDYATHDWAIAGELRCDRDARAHGA